MNGNKRLWLSMVAGLLVLPALRSEALTEKQEKMLQQLNQLDQLDRMDFTEQYEKANACIRRRDFACAEKSIAEAAKYAGNSDDRRTLTLARQNLAAERQYVAEEERAAAESRRAEQREREREERRQAREEQLAREEREAEERQSTKEYYAAIGAQILQSAAENAALLNQIDRQTNAAIRDSNRVLAAQAAERDRARAERDEREAERRREVARERDSREAAQRLARADATDRENQRRAELERANEQKRREREAQQREEQRRIEQQAQQERSRQQDLQRKRDAADLLAKKEAEKAAEAQEKKAYLTAMLNGIRLVATKCPDGEGHYYATGKVPKVKGGSCIDVHYQASCPGSRVTSNGVAKNFIGMSGCFGDTYQIEPKPACPADQVRVVVTDVQPGCN